MLLLYLKVTQGSAEPIPHMSLCCFFPHSDLQTEALRFALHEKEKIHRENKWCAEITEQLSKMTAGSESLPTAASLNACFEVTDDSYELCVPQNPLHNGNSCLTGKKWSPKG